MNAPHPSQSAACSAAAPMVGARENSAGKAPLEPIRNSPAAAARGSAGRWRERAAGWAAFRWSALAGDRTSSWLSSLLLHATAMLLLLFVSAFAVRPFNPPSELVLSISVDAMLADEEDSAASFSITDDVIASSMEGLAAVEMPIPDVDAWAEAAPAGAPEPDDGV